MLSVDCWKYITSRSRFSSPPSQPNPAPSLLRTSLHWKPLERQDERKENRERKKQGRSISISSHEPRKLPFHCCFWPSHSLFPFRPPEEKEGSIFFLHQKKITLEIYLPYTSTRRSVSSRKLKSHLILPPRNIYLRQDFLVFLL